MFKHINPRLRAVHCVSTSFDHREHQTEQPLRGGSLEKAIRRSDLPDISGIPPGCLA